MGSDQPLVTTVEGLVPDADLDAAPGVSIGVVGGDRDVVACEGVTNVEHPLPVTPDTLFQIGSLTKTFTATAAVACLADGLLAPTDRARDLVGELPDDAAEVTVEHLLTHTGGWFGDELLANPPETGEGEDALRRLMPHLAALPRLFPPGRCVSYDNAGFALLGRIVEHLRGRPYDRVVMDDLLRPLEMTRSCYQPDDAITHRVCAGHQLRPGGSGDELVVARGMDPWAGTWAMRRALWPTGGAISSAADMLRWARFHLGLRAGGPLGDEWRRRMQQPMVVYGGRGTARGLGWLVETSGPAPIVGHNGSTQGFVAHLALVPERHAALVVLTNSELGQRIVDRVRRWFLHERLGLEETPEPSPGQAGIPAPLDVSALAGHYQTPARRITVAVEDEELRVSMAALAPGTFQPAASVFHFTGPTTLETVEPPRLTLDVGPVEDSRVAWLRFRGRVHPAVRITA